jgi:hypothetical protein
MLSRVRPGTSGPGLDVAGVFRRGIGPSAAPAPHVDGWTRDDLDYDRAEADAALLGWLSAVACREVDRLPAWLWYNTRPRCWARELHSRDAACPRSTRSRRMTRRRYKCRQDPQCRQSPGLVNGANGTLPTAMPG